MNTKDTKKLKIIFAGTPDFAVSILKTLLKNKNFKIEMVITQPDKPMGRKHILTPLYVKKFALSNKLIVQQPENIKNIAERISDLKPDFIVVIGYGQIFPKKILKIPKFGCINIHFSLLPKYRGASPVQETLLHGDKKTGISIILMNEGLDEGDILQKKEIIIEDKDTTQTLLEKLSNLSAKLLPYTLINFANRKIKPIKQKKTTISHCRKIKKENGLIDFKKETAKQIFNKIRAYNKWPGCFWFLKGKRIKIYSAEYNEQKNSSGMTVRNDELEIGAKKGVLYPKTIQMEGRKIMTIKEFLNGYKNLFRVT